MDLTLQDILAQLYDSAYWDGVRGRHGWRQPAVDRAADLLVPLQDGTEVALTPAIFAAGRGGEEDDIVSRGEPLSQG